MNESLANYCWIDQPYNFSHRSDLDALGIPTDGLQFIHESTLLDNNELDADRISGLIDQCRRQTQQLPVLCLDRNYFPTIDHLKIELEKIADPMTYVLLEPNDVPHWLLQSRTHPTYPRSREKSYRIGYLSGGVRYHRLFLADKIRPHVKDQDVVVINDYDMENYENTVPVGSTDHMDYVKDIPWASDGKFVDFKREVGQEQQAMNHDTIHPAYDTKIHIIGETGGPYDPCLVSEKTWKAILNRCLTVTWGPMSNPTYLKRSGIELLPIDEITDANDKLKAMIELFKRDDIDDIYHDNRDLIEHNHALVTSHQYAVDLVKPVHNRIMARL